MRNQFAGTCYRCGETVEAGAGHLEYGAVGRGWRVQRAECAMQFRSRAGGKPGETEQREAWQQRRLQERAQGTGKRAQRARQAIKGQLI